MLYNPEILIEPEYIDRSIVLIAGPPLQAVQDDKVAFSHDALDFHVFAGPLARHPIEIVDEPSLACRYMWIVLDIVDAGISLRVVDSR
jgi:hypothetical protein